MIKKLIIAFAGLTFLVVITTAFFQLQMGGEELQKSLQSFKSIGIIFRGIGLIFIIGYWDVIVSFIGKRQDWAVEQIDNAVSNKWKIAAYMVSFELLVIQGLFGKLLNTLIGN